MLDPTGYEIYIGRKLKLFGNIYSTSILLGMFSLIAINKAMELYISLLF
jgi:hypothetical protein